MLAVIAITCTLYTLLQSPVHYTQYCNHLYTIHTTAITCATSQLNYKSALTADQKCFYLYLYLKQRWNEFRQKVRLRVQTIAQMTQQHTGGMLGESGESGEAPNQGEGICTVHTLPLTPLPSPHGGCGGQREWKSQREGEENRCNTFFVNNSRE